MDEMAGLRKKLEQSLGQQLPDYVWCNRRVQRAASECLDSTSDADREDAWSILEDEAGERLDVWNEGRKEGLRGVRSGTLGGSEEMREAASRDSGGARRLDAGWFVGDRTQAMTGAMSALFALIGDQLPEVVEFRKRVLPGRYLAADEAHAFIASYAARTFDFRWFEKWAIPIVGHRAKVLDTGPRGEHYSPVDDTMTIRVDPPGITRTVRYAYPQEGDPHTTRCITRSGAIVPIHNHLPIEAHGDSRYPSWLWPGSVVDELYDLSVELASAFDWPGGLERNMTATRPWSRTAAWFVLTGEAPQVRPIDARWEEKSGGMYLSPQWRIRLTVPPWLPEEEVLRALRMLRRYRPKGQQLPKTARPLEVARFVWERERLDGYREPPLWTAWLKQWNEEHPGHRIETASNFRTYFLRGNKAVRRLNYDWPDFKQRRGTSDAT